MQQVDARLNEWQGAIDGINGISVTDARVNTNSLASLNASVSLDIVGKATLMVHVNVTVAFNAATTMIVEGTVDGSNFFQMPFFIVSGGSVLGASETMALTFPGSLATGQYLICTSATGFKSMRVRMNAFTTAGTAVVAMRATQADYRIYTQPIPANLNVSLSASGAVNTGGTITLPLVAGLFHYVTGFDITLSNAVANAAAGNITVTTTNLPGTPSWCFCPTAAAITVQSYNTFAFEKAWIPPLKSSAAGTNTTFVIPNPGSNTIVRANVSYYLGA